MCLCNLMRNGNPADEFLHVYCDPNGVARFVKARFAKADQRITWAWDTIAGRAKHKVAVGFYPWNHRGESCWAAMDFDAHDGDAARARALAAAALQVLLRYPQLYLILATSGSHGWHLFVFSDQFQPVSDWVRLLKRVADRSEPRSNPEYAKSSQMKRETALDHMRSELLEPGIQKQISSAQFSLRQ